MELSLLHACKKRQIFLPWPVLFSDVRDLNKYDQCLDLASLLGLKFIAFVF